MLLVNDEELAALDGLPADDFKLYFTLKSVAQQEGALRKVQMANERYEGMDRLEAHGLIERLNGYAFMFGRMVAE